MTPLDPNWQNAEDIDRWVGEWRQQRKHRNLSFRGKVDPIEELRDRLAHAHFIGKDKVAVESYLQNADQLAYRISDQGKADREEKMVRAAERSARWAAVAVFVSLAALLIAAWPFISARLG